MPPLKPYTGCLTALTVALLAVTSGAVARQTDEPDDSARLPDVLHLQWVRDFNPPRNPNAPPRGFQDPLPTVLSAPLVHDDLVVVGLGAPRGLLAMDIASGAIRWQADADGPIRHAPAADEQTLYAVCDDGYAYAFDADSGARRWRTRVAPDDSLMLRDGRVTACFAGSSRPCLEEDMLLVTFGSWRHSVAALDTSTGKLVWLHDVAIALDADPYSDSGWLCVQDSRSFVCDLNLENGLPTWQSVSRAPRGDGWSFPPRQQWKITAVGYYQFRPEADGRHVLFYYNYQKEQPVHKHSTVAVDAPIQGMAAGSGRLVVCTQSGRVYCFGAEAIARPRELKWRGGSFRATEGLSAARRYFAAHDPGEGYVAVVGLDDGRLVEGLIQQSEDIRIVCIDTAERIAAVRKYVARRQSPGRPIDYVAAAPSSFSELPCLAELVVSERLPRMRWTGQTKLVASMLRMAGPGGAVPLVLSFEDHERALKDLQAAGIDATVERDGPRMVTLLRPKEGKPPGDYDWLWTRALGFQLEYLPPYDWAENVNNCLLLSSPEGLTAADAWTGRYRWRHRWPPHANPLEPARPARGRELTAAEVVGSFDGVVHEKRNEVFVAEGPVCRVLDLTTGAEKRRFDMPLSSRPGHLLCWGDLCLRGDTLVGLVYDPDEMKPLKHLWSRRYGMELLPSKFLIGIDCVDGALRWTVKAESRFAAPPQREMQRDEVYLFDQVHPLVRYLWKDAGLSSEAQPPALIAVSSDGTVQDRVELSAPAVTAWGEDAGLYVALDPEAEAHQKVDVAPEEDRLEMICFAPGDDGLGAGKASDKQIPSTRLALPDPCTPGRLTYGIPWPIVLGGRRVAGLWAAPKPKEITGVDEKGIRATVCRMRSRHLPGSSGWQGVDLVNERLRETTGIDVELGCDPPHRLEILPARIKAEDRVLADVVGMGYEGVTEVTCRLPESRQLKAPATVRLHFAELDLTVEPGDRIFDIHLQGECVKEGFDILAAAGDHWHAVTLEFTDIEDPDHLDIEFRPHKNSRRPVLCGFEIRP